MNDSEKKQTVLIPMKETAEILGIHPATLWRWIKAGKIRKVPGTRFVPRSEIDRLREGREL